ncbi:MAG: hypothetical protein QMB20_02485, partial [Flavobacteriales bacterium]
LNPMVKRIMASSFFMLNPFVNWRFSASIKNKNFLQKQKCRACVVQIGSFFLSLVELNIIGRL